MRFHSALAATVALGLIGVAHAQQPRQQAAPAPTEWRPDWAKELPYTPPDGTIGIFVFPHNRSPCQLQIYIANGTNAAIREIFGVMLLHTPNDRIPARFHLSYIDPQTRRGGGAMGNAPCPRGVTRVELREVSPCSRDRAHMRGCGAPIVAIAPRMERRSDIIEFTVAPDYDR